MAVYDEDTQKMLSELQGRIISEVSSGTQTMGIPFHITLGSYPTNMEKAVVEMVREAASSTESFSIQLLGYGDFENRVLYAEPSIPSELVTLRKRFECDYAEDHPWVPHTTLFCGDLESVNGAKALLPMIDEPISAQIVGLELGEFFPTRMLMKEDFK